MRLLLCFLLLCAPLAAQTLTLDVPRPDATRITAYLDRPAGRFPLVLICQGSEALSVAPKYTSWAQRLGEQGIGTLRVEKPGLTAESKGASQEYLRLNTLSRRVLDILEVLAQLRRTQPEWDGRLAVLGGSEGGEVAAQVAALLPPDQLKGLVVVVAGTTETFGYSLSHSIPNPPPDLGQQFAEMRQETLWSREWASDGKTARNTYKWWAESLDVVTAISLDKLSCPIYILHGDQDRLTPPACEAPLRERLKGKNLRYVRVPGCGHDIAGNAEGRQALEEAVDWVVARLKL